MPLYLIGLGLGDEQDITIKGLTLCKSSKYIYLETYTSILTVNKEKLEELIGIEIHEADRQFVESGVEEMLELAQISNVSFLVVGDVFCATTHADLYLRAIKRGIEVRVVHNASIISAMGITGLQVYRFGEIVSIPFFTQAWRPLSFYDKIKNNRSIGLHTLLLLDIKVKEPTLKAMLSGKEEYETPRFMSSQIAADQLLEAEMERKEEAYSPETLCIGLARIGAKNQLIVSGRLVEFSSMGKIDLGEPLHSLIICAQVLHEIELEMFELYAQKKQ